MQPACDSADEDYIKASYCGNKDGNSAAAMDHTSALLEENSKLANAGIKRSGKKARARKRKNKKARNDGSKDCNGGEEGKEGCLMDGAGDQKPPVKGDGNGKEEAEEGCLIDGNWKLLVKNHGIEKGAATKGTKKDKNQKPPTKNQGIEKDAATKGSMMDKNQIKDVGDWTFSGKPYHQTSREWLSLSFDSRDLYQIKETDFFIGNCNSAHFTARRELFSRYTAYPPGQKYLDVRDSPLPIEALGYGEIKLRFPGPDGETKEIAIQAIHGKMGFNLLSLSRLRMDMIIGHGGGWALKTKNGIFAVGPLRAGLPALRTYGRGSNGQDVGMSCSDITAAASGGKVADGTFLAHTGGACGWKNGAMEGPMFGSRVNPRTANGILGVSVMKDLF